VTSGSFRHIRGKNIAGGTAALALVLD
jgi:hypothetical protein